MNDSPRESFLAALDARLSPEGFRLRRRSQSWRRETRGLPAIGIHVNFGRSSQPLAVIPTIGVRYDSIEGELVRAGIVQAGAIKDRFTFARPLTVVADGVYEVSATEGPGPTVDRIWADWCAEGRSFAEQLSDLDAVITMLESDIPAQWCCASRSDRARLLPVALAVSGRFAEASDWLPRLGEDIRGRDQMLPEFDAFRTWFSERWQVGK
jgi:hypothetical protein